jgi:hypothetical protein
MMSVSYRRAAIAILGSTGILAAGTGMVGSTSAAIAQEIAQSTIGDYPGSPSEPVGTAIPPGSSGSVADIARFQCQNIDGQPTVLYSPQSQPDRLYPWAVPQALGGGWSPERRCREIARRLESYRPQGLVDMTVSVENGYDIVCVTTEQVPGCQIVFTVPPGQDPLVTRDRVFANLSLADTGQTTQGVYTFAGSNRSWVGEAVSVLEEITGRGGWSGDRAPRRSEPDQPWDQPAPSREYRSTAIYLRPFLDPADGGTGQYLYRD